MITTIFKDLKLKCRQNSSKSQTLPDYLVAKIHNIFNLSNWNFEN